MTRSVLSLVVMVSLAGISLAQDTPPSESEQMRNAPGMMGQEMNHDQRMMEGMMPMMQMMMQCMDMMAKMHGEGMTGMGMDPTRMMPGMMRGQMGRGMMEGAVRYNRSAAEALARAFLAGYAPGAEIAEVDYAVEYRVTFTADGMAGTLLIDAATGEVRLVPDGE